MTRRRWLALAAGLALGSWVACSRERPSAGNAPGGRRVVSLAPSVTEALFAMGAGGQLVGRSRFCDFPPEARALPVVGDVDPDLEAIVERRPDLVVGLAGLSSAQLADRLEARHIPHWFPDTGSLAAIDELLSGLGERTGHAPQARALVEAIEAKERDVERAVAGEAKPRVLLVVSLAPVVVAGPRSFADELIARAGGQNVVDTGGAWPTPGFENLLAMDPDVVLEAAAMGPGDPARITEQSTGWSKMRAVRLGHVVPLRDERVLRAGPRIAEGLAVLAGLLHPGAAGR